jgi:SAM-dependent methyltransferase
LFRRVIGAERFVILGWVELDDDTRASLIDAGAGSLDVNAPMSARRGDDIGDFVARLGATMLDIGCGSGWLACRTAVRHPSLAIVGVDIDQAAIERGRSLALDEGVADRVRFAVGDAASLMTTTETAVCVGASHAFGDTEAMLRALRDLASLAAVVGDGIWLAEPDEAIEAMFGQLPLGVDGLVAVAERCGWTVADADVSTLEEWDRFESGWCGGVRDVGTAEAVAFADARWAEYQNYRGVLGFGWLYLVQTVVTSVGPAVTSD